jgi:hypothetical protein
MPDERQHGCRYATGSRLALLVLPGAGPALYDESRRLGALPDERCSGAGPASPISRNGPTPFRAFQPGRTPSLTRRS